MTTVFLVPFLGDFTTGNTVTAMTTSAMVVTALSVVAGPAVGRASAGMGEVLDRHVENADVDRIPVGGVRHPEVHKVLKIDKVILGSLNYYYFSFWVSAFWMSP